MRSNLYSEDAILSVDPEIMKKVNALPNMSTTRMLNPTEIDSEFATFCRSPFTIRIAIAPARVTKYNNLKLEIRSFPIPQLMRVLTIKENIMPIEVIMAPKNLRPIK